MIAIVDYGVGNLFSLKSSLAALGFEAVVSGDAGVLAGADRIILPGVGAFGDAMQKLTDSGLAPVITDLARVGKPLLGICLGMQLLFSESEEYGLHRGLDLIPGRIVPMAGRIPPSLKIPQIGWNSLDFPAQKPVSPLFSGIRAGDFVYFVHSFFATDCEPAVIATTQYGAALTAAVQRDNIYGCQFHPEKSGPVGLAILRAFCTL